VTVVAMSGGAASGTADQLAAAQALGAVHALRKPFGVPALLEAVQQALQGGPAA
jgi:CheY-like chemotaxis protein